MHATGQAAHIDVPEKFHEPSNGSPEFAPSVRADHDSRRRSTGGFSCTLYAIGRRYLYRILPRRQPPALDLGRVWHHKQRLDPELMARAAKHLLGHHDFTSFRASHVRQSRSFVPLTGLIKRPWQKRYIPYRSAIIPASSGTQHHRNPLCRHRKMASR